MLTRAGTAQRALCQGEANSSKQEPQEGIVIQWSLVSQMRSSTSTQKVFFRPQHIGPSASTGNLVCTISQPLSTAGETTAGRYYTYLAVKKALGAFKGMSTSGAESRLLAEGRRWQAALNYSPEPVGSHGTKVHPLPSMCAQVALEVRNFQ